MNAPQRTRIKVCGITTQPALAAAVHAGADAVGFVLAQSPRRVTPEQARDLAADLPSLLNPILVYRHPPPDLARTAAELIPRATHQSDHADFAQALSRTPRAQRLPVFRVTDAFERHLTAFLASKPTTDVLIEGPRSGAGETADWPRVAAIAAQHPSLRITLAGGLNPDNVAEAISIVRPFAVDVSSGVEAARGVKDPSLIAAFAHAVRTADATLNAPTSL